MVAGPSSRFGQEFWLSVLTESWLSAYTALGTKHKLKIWFRRSRCHGEANVGPSRRRKEEMSPLAAADTGTLNFKVTLNSRKNSKGTPSAWDDDAGTPERGL